MQFSSWIDLPTSNGIFRAAVACEYPGSVENFVLVYGDPISLLANGGAPMVRLHSECLTGDVFGSLRCDCGPQLEQALKRIAAVGHGVVIYLRQEGRGIGLFKKIESYRLQENGLDTIDANLALGYPADMRSYAAAAEILSALGITRLELLTNNPDKCAQLERYGLEVIKRQDSSVPINSHNFLYQQTKRERLGHFIGNV